MKIDDQVIRIVAKYSGHMLHEVHPASTLHGDLMFDSLDCLEVVLALEEAFEIEIEDELAEKFKTVQDIIDHVQRQVSGVAA